MTFKKKKCRTKFAAENHFHRAKDQSSIALDICNPSEMNVNQYVEGKHVFCYHGKKTKFHCCYCCLSASWPFTELTLIEWEIGSCVSINSICLLLCWFRVSKQQKKNWDFCKDGIASMQLSDVRVISSNHILGTFFSAHRMRFWAFNRHNGCNQPSNWFHLGIKLIDSANCVNICTLRIFVKMNHIDSRPKHEINQNTPANTHHSPSSNFGFYRTGIFIMKQLLKLLALKLFLWISNLCWRCRHHHHHRCCCCFLNI